MSLLIQLKEEMKNAMRAKDKRRLGVIRMALSAIKQAEIDHNTEASYVIFTAILTKMVTLRKESIKMFTDVGRDELAAKEAEEVKAIEFFLPQPLSEAEVKELIDNAINETGAASMADMGKLMAVLKPLLQGKADMGAVSSQVRAALT
jgi:uncharacterized protein YqeY